jgi:hypothetical protein
MEIYLLSLALSRHRMIVPQPRRGTVQVGGLATPEHSCDAQSIPDYSSDAPGLAPARIDEPSLTATLQPRSR